MKILSLLCIGFALLQSTSSHAMAAKHMFFEITATRNIEIQIQGNGNNYKSGQLESSPIGFGVDLQDSGCVRGYCWASYELTSVQQSIAMKFVETKCGKLLDDAIVEACKGKSGKSYTITSDGCTYKAVADPMDSRNKYDNRLTGLGGYGLTNRGNQGTCQ